VCDIDKEKEKNVAEKYSIDYGEMDVMDGKILLMQPSGAYDFAIISTPPLTKQPFINIANQYGLKPFVEADITEYSGKYCPSATMRFHPGVIKIKELLSQMGKVYSFTYHHGSHLSDWRPNGFPADYYATKKESSACMEMFAFELSWLSYLFGIPVDACGFVGKQLDIKNVTADDVYSTIVKFEKLWLPPQAFPVFNRDIAAYKNLMGVKSTITGTFQCDMVTRPTIRELRISAEKGTLVWNWKDSFIKLDNADGTIVTHGFNKGEAAQGYNPSITENMYEDELRNWISSIKGEETYRYSRDEEESVMEMLAKVEGINQ
jgi:predicted dehydrogenase